MFALNCLAFLLIFTTVIAEFQNVERYNDSSEIESLPGEQAALVINETTIAETATTILFGDVNDTHNDNHAFENETMGQNLELASNETGIQFAPTFTHRIEMFDLQIKPAGSSVRLSCTADGNPMPNITWSKNNGPIEGQNVQPSNGKWSMSLDKLSNADDGDYTCLVCNELGCINHTVILYVQEYNASSKNESLPGEQEAPVINETTIAETATTILIGDVNDTHNDNHAFENDTMGQNLELASNETGIKFAPTFTHQIEMFDLQIKPAGSSIRLGCTADGNPMPNITWSKNNGPIEGQNVQPSNGKWSMSLDKLSNADDGNYTCLVCNELGCINHTVILHVQEYNDSSENVSLPGKQAAPVINETTITETATTNVIEDVNNTHNDNHIIENETIGQNHELTSNETGIKFAPTFKHPSKMYNMDMKPAGSSIRLKCKADGNPMPNITWSKNNGPIVRQYLQPSYGKWSMTLDELTKADDGNYTCLVCNELGCIDHTVILHVQERLYSKPILVRGAVNQTKHVGETANFSCEFLSDLHTTTIWKHLIKDDINENNITNYINHSNDSIPPMTSQYTNDIPGKLTIYNVTKEEEGWYVCVGRNSLGEASAKGYLTVLDKRYPRKPYVKEGYPGNTTTFVNNTVRLSCPIITDLEPFVYWLKPAKNYIGSINVGAEEPIPEGLVIESEDNTDKPGVLTLYKVSKEQAGWYVCVALNTLGRASAKGYLTVLDRNN